MAILWTQHFTHSIGDTQSGYVRWSESALGGIPSKRKAILARSCEAQSTEREHIGNHFVVRADEKLTAFLELESAFRDGLIGAAAVC